MKIRKLTIHNIASIEDAVIDFTQAPLADSDVFLITGDTGSGKSTILDALCLALYATTPRMENSQMEGAIVDAGEVKVQVEDPRRLLREGSGRGYVELEFDGSNGIPYKANWIARRANDRATGRLQARTWTLENLRTGRTLTGKDEIEAEIALATGLASFDQFCRTTMLAQGDFTRFLNSKDNEKASILEKITGADIYARIGKKIYDLSKAKAEEYVQAKREAEGITPLPPKDREAKETEVEALKRQSTEEGENKAQSEKKLRFLREEKRLKEDIQSAEDAMKEAEKIVKTDEFKSKATQVRQYEETSEVRAQLSTFIEKTKEADDAAQKISHLAETYSSLRAGLAYRSEEASGLRENLEALQKAIDTEKPDLPVIEKAQTVEGYLKTMMDGTRKMAGWSEEVKNVEDDIIQHLQPALDAALEQKEDAETAHSRAQRAHEDAENELKEANLSQVRVDLGAKKDLERNITLAHNQLTALREAKVSREKEEKAIGEDETALMERKRQADILNTDYEVKKAAYVKEKETYDKVMEAKDAKVAAIRGKLSVGDTCPVCRQKIMSVLPAEEVISAIVQPVEEAYEKANDEMGKAKERLVTIQSQIIADERALNSRRGKFENENPIPAKENAALEALRKCGIEVLSDTAESDLNKLLERTQGEIAVLNGLIEAGKALEEKETEARRKEKECRESKTQKETEHTEARKKVDEAKGKIERYNLLSKEEQERIDAAGKELELIVAGSRWETVWKQDLKSFGESLTEAVRLHESNEEQKRGLNGQISEIETEVEAVDVQLRAVVEMEAVWSDRPALPAAAVPGLKQKAEHLREDVLVNESILSRARRDAKDAEKEVTSFLEEHKDYTRALLSILSDSTKDEIDRKKQEVITANAAIGNAEAVKQNSENNLAKLLEDKPEIGEGETEETLENAVRESETSIRNMAVRKALVEKELKDDEDNRKTHKDRLTKAEELKLEADKWGRLNDMIGSADGKAFRRIAQSYVLGSLVHAANDYMATLSDRYTLKVHPGTFIIELEDAYQGYASRVASTISGGESFLVSLSLALALSDMGSGLSVDTIFIDEGFGTLSGEPLRRAVDTLKSLNKQMGRHVGIISHIKDLRDQIPVRIVVEQPSHSSASTVKTIG